MLRTIAWLLMTWAGVAGPIMACTGRSTMWPLRAPGAGGDTSSSGGDAGACVPGSCPTARWCDDGVCAPCTTDLHCGDTCDDCTATGMVCTGDGRTCRTADTCVANPTAARCRADDSTAGWCAADSYIGDLQFDAAHGKLYVTSVYSWVGTKNLLGVIKLDAKTWTVDACWSYGSTPAFNAIFNDTHVWFRAHHGEGHLVPVATTRSCTAPVVAVLDGEANSITTYAFADVPAYGLTKNVSYTTTECISGTWLDLSAMRLYLLFYSQGTFSGTHIVGYLDLAEPGPSYSFHEIISTTHGAYETHPNQDAWLTVIPEEDAFVITGVNAGDLKGRTWVYRISDGTLLKNYGVDTHPSYPYNGTRRVAYSGGKLYAGFPYQASYGAVDQRGLVAIDLATDAITYLRPTWAAVDDYGVGEVRATTAGKLVFVSRGQGLAGFNPAGPTWTLWNNSTLGGLAGDTSETWMACAHDDAALRVFGGYGDVTTWRGVVMFNE